MNLHFNAEKQRMLLFLPLLILPFILLGFYALKQPAGATPPQLSELNFQLPRPILKDTARKGKIDIYQSAKKDSAVNAERKHAGFSSLSTPLADTEHETRQIEQKLVALEGIVKTPYTYTKEKKPASAIQLPAVKQSNAEIDRLEQLMQSLNTQDADPQLDQLESILEKIITIQQDDKESPAPSISAANQKDTSFIATPAMIANKQRVTEGSRVGIQLSDTLRISGRTLPPGHTLFGICQLRNQRLFIDIKTIRFGREIIPVQLRIYDLDGMPGMDAPEANVAEAASAGADRFAAGLRIPGAGATLTTQAAEAGLDAARSLVRKKVRRAKVRLAQGRPVLVQTFTR